MWPSDRWTMWLHGQVSHVALWLSSHMALCRYTRSYGSVASGSSGSVAVVVGQVVLLQLCTVSLLAQRHVCHSDRWELQYSRPSVSVVSVSCGSMGRGSHAAHRQI